MSRIFNDLWRLREPMIKYLSSQNPNINWNMVIERLHGKDDIHILRTIKAKLWTDKNIEHETFMSSNVKWFQYYTRLLNLFMKPILECKHVYVLDIASDVGERLSDEMLDDIRDKINVLNRMLKMFGVKCECVQNIDVGMKVVFTTGSVTYVEPTKMFNGWVGCIVLDDYDNTSVGCDKDQLSVNNMILHIKDVLDGDADEIERSVNVRRFGMLCVNFNR